MHAGDEDAAGKDDAGISLGINDRVATILRCRQHLASRESFTLETTLVVNGAIGILHEATLAGYKTHLVSVSLGDPEFHIERLRFRVFVRGPDIGDADVHRRCRRSLARGLEALRLADSRLYVL